MKEWKRKLQHKFNEINGEDAFIIIGFLMGHLVFFDYGRKLFWKLPKIQKASENIYQIGWLYWAICITKNKYGELKK